MSDEDEILVLPDCIRNQQFLNIELRKENKELKAKVAEQAEVIKSLKNRPLQVTFLP